MRKIAVLALLCGFELTPGLTQRAATEDAGLMLAAAKMNPAFRSRIEREIFRDQGLSAAQVRDEAARTPVGRLRLGPRGRWVWWVTAAQDRCGNNACTYWLFDPVTGSSLVGDAEGFGLDLLDTRHHGWLDFTTGAPSSYCIYVTMYYQFDGHEYQLARTDKQNIGCDQ